MTAILTAVLALLKDIWKPLGVFLGGLWLQYTAKKQARLEVTAEVQKQKLEDTDLILKEIKANDKITSDNAKLSAAALAASLRNDERTS